jgi:NADH:ubiquinone oxidoreductase subunit 2 (subunit N)
VAAALAQSGHFALLTLGVFGTALSLAAVAGTMRVMYLQSPPEEARRTTRLPVLSGLSSFGAMAFCVVIAVYGIFSSPILGLADQGAEALGLR